MTLSNYLKENLVCSENWSRLSFKWQSDQVIKRLSSCLLTLFISSTFQPNIGQKELPLPGNGQPKSAGDDFVQDLASPGQGVPSGVNYLSFNIWDDFCVGLYIFPGSVSWSILEEQGPASKTGLDGQKERAEFSNNHLRRSKPEKPCWHSWRWRHFKVQLVRRSDPVQFKVGTGCWPFTPLAHCTLNQISQ